MLSLQERRRKLPRYEVTGKGSNVESDGAAGMSRRCFSASTCLCMRSDETVCRFAVEPQDIMILA